MTYKFTVRGAPAAIIRRTYRCTDCAHEFSWVHASTEEVPPECPVCVSAPPPVLAPALPGLLTSKSAAIDFTQKMVEQDYGLTNFRDNSRPGDVAYMPDAPMHTAQRDAVTRELIQAGVPEPIAAADNIEKAANYWQGAMAGAASGTLGSPTAAAEASREARAMGVDPVGMLEAGRKSGNLPLKLNVVARSDG